MQEDTVSVTAGTSQVSGPPESKDEKSSFIYSLLFP